MDEVRAPWRKCVVNEWATSYKHARLMFTYIFYARMTESLETHPYTCAMN